MAFDSNNHFYLAAERAGKRFKEMMTNKDEHDISTPIAAIFAEAECLADTELHDFKPLLTEPDKYIASRIMEVAASKSTPDIKKAEHRLAMELLADELGIKNQMLTIVNQQTIQQNQRSI